MEWNEDNIYAKFKCKLTSDYFAAYTEPFFNWYKKQNAEDLDKWADHLLAIRMLKFDKKDKPLYDFAMEMEQHKVDMFLEYRKDDFLDLKHKEYKRYLKDEKNNYIEHSIKEVNVLFWPDADHDYSVEDKATLVKLSRKFRIFSSASRRLAQHQHLRSPDIIIKNDHQILAEKAQILNDHILTEDELKLLGRIYDDYDNFKTPSSYHDNKEKEFEKKRTEIQSLYRSMLEKGLPHQDVYRKSKRLPGAGWSKQK